MVIYLVSFSLMPKLVKYGIKTWNNVHASSQNILKPDTPKLVNDSHRRIKYLSKSKHM